MRDERKLIKKIKYRQDKDAAGELIRRYYQEMFAYVYRQTGDRELALDLTQEIFLAVLRGLGSFDEKKAGFRTWLYRIASNKLTDYYRSRSHRQKAREVPLKWESREDGSGGGSSGASGVSERTHSFEREASEKETDMLSALIQKETVQRVMELAAEYDRVWIMIFQRRIFLEYTFAEIALELELPESTVKTRYYQMIREIRKEMEGDE